MRVAVAQIEVIPGRPDKNLKACIEAQQRAFSDGADLIALPELCLSGYLIGDLWEEASFVEELVEMGRELSRAATQGVSCFGNVGLDRARCGEDGRPRRFNAAWVSDHGVIKSHPAFDLPFIPKTLLPNYREFEETRYFFDGRRLALEHGWPKESGVAPLCVHIGDKERCIGVYLCEDGWHDDYGFDIPRTLVDKGAECLINLSGSPFTLHKEQKRHRVFSAQAAALRTPLVYVNCTGMQNNGKTVFSFDGDTTVYDRTGAVIYEAPHFIPAYQIVDLNTASPVESAVAPEIDRVFQCLESSVGRYMARFGLTRAVIGVSGGIDSAVSAAFFTHLLGPDNVLLVNMPSRYNTAATRTLADALSRNLTAWRATIPIEESVSLTRAQVDGLTICRERASRTLGLSAFHLENVQARDRTSRILAAVGAAFGGVFPSNANKAETMVGYTTLYGDHAGFLAPFADLWKHQIYALGTYLNVRVFGRAVIPQGIFDIVPSAELSADQNPESGKGDPLVYWYHDKLFEAWMQHWHRASPEEILTWYRDGTIEERLSLGAPVATIFPTAEAFIADLERWWCAFKGLGVVKRVQAPPVAAVCRRAFGFDYRESLLQPYFTRRYRSMKAAILERP